MSTKKKSTKMGTRYTDAQKQEVIDFVNGHNTANGRGGQSAAAAKFGVSQLTIASWLKGGGNGKPGKKAKGAKAIKGAKKVATQGAKRGRKPAGGNDLSGKLSELMSVHGLIAKAEKELAGLKAKFDQLKRAL